MDLRHCSTHHVQNYNNILSHFCMFYRSCEKAANQGSDTLPPPKKLYRNSGHPACLGLKSYNLLILPFFFFKFLPLPLHLLFFFLPFLFPYLPPFLSFSLLSSISFHIKDYQVLSCKFNFLLPSRQHLSYLQLSAVL